MSKDRRTLLVKIQSGCLDTVRSRAFLGLGLVMQSAMGRDRIVVRGSDDSAFTITFDDGPDPEWTPRIAELLARRGQTGTFFLVGSKAMRYKTIARDLISRGHSVGHHTFGHRNLLKLSRSHAIREWLDGRAAVEDAVGSRCRLFRPPHGLVPAHILDKIWASGDRIVLWTYSTRDYSGEGHGMLWPRLRVRGVMPGDILLLHDTSGVSLKLTESILDLGRRMGLSAAHVS